MRTRTLLKTLAVLALLPLGVVAEEAFDYTYFDMTYLNNGMDGTVTAFDGLDRTDIIIGEGDGIGLHMSLALDRNFHVFAGYSGSNMDMDVTQQVPYPSWEQIAAAFFSTPAAANWDGRCDLSGDGRVNFIDLIARADAEGQMRETTHALVDGDMTDWRLGLGYNRLVAPNVDAYVQLFWDARELDFGRVSFIDGIRDFDASETGVGATIGMRGRVTDRLELRGKVTYSPVGDVYMLGETDADMLRDDTLIGISGVYRFTDRFSLFAEMEGDGDVRSWMLGMRYGPRS